MTLEEVDFGRFRVDSLATSHHASARLSQPSHVTLPSSLSTAIKSPTTKPTQPDQTDRFQRSDLSNTRHELTDGSLQIDTSGIPYLAKVFLINKQ